MAFQRLLRVLTSEGIFRQMAAIWRRKCKRSACVFIPADPRGRTTVGEASQLLLQANLFTPDSSAAIDSISKTHRRKVRLTVQLLLLVSHTHTHTQMRALLHDEQLIQCRH